jgi:hypothetical protein
MLVLTAAALGVSVASGQSIVSARAGLIHLAEGTLLIDGEAVTQNGDQFLSMKQGQTLSTERGRAEILLNAGSYLRIGENSSFKLVSADLEDTRIGLLSGTVLIEVADLPKDTSATISLLGSDAALRKRGLYEFSADAPGYVRVHDGELTLTAAGATPIKIGKGREIAFNALSAGPGKFDQSQTSELYNWGSRRAIYIAAANQSAARSLNSNGFRSQSMLGTLGSYRGVWLFDPYFGIYTYLPLSGFGYSPYGRPSMSAQRNRFPPGLTPLRILCSGPLCLRPHTRVPQPSAARPARWQCQRLQPQRFPRRTRVAAAMPGGGAKRPARIPGEDSVGCAVSELGYRWN